MVSCVSQLFRPRASWLAQAHERAWRLAVRTTMTLALVDGARRQGRPHPGMKLAVLDPRAGLGKALIELADVAHPIAEAAPVGIEAPDADHDLLRHMTLELGAVQQHRQV